MSTSSRANVNGKVAAQELTPAPLGVVQHKCACGSASITGECQCGARKPAAQRWATDRGLPEELLPQATSSFAGSAFSRDLDRVPSVTRGLSTTGPIIQRAVADLSLEDTTPVESVEQIDEPVNEPTQPAPVPGLIVDDAAESVSPEQMRKSEFLEKLRASVCATADRALSSVGRSTESCPYIERWIGHYLTRPAGYVERALRKYAPETSSVTSASDYIPLISDRIGRAVTRWATTGEITDVPEELRSQIPGMGLMGAVGGFLSGIGGAIAGAVSGIAGAVSSIGSMLFKEKNGGAREAADPQSVRSQLGAGSSLDGGVKSRMEPAFGHDFSRVRVHADSRAAELATGLNARAFTIGSDIAFARGEYRPGTPIGDALVAHELAHVVQQSAGDHAAPAQSNSPAAKPDRLEEEADDSAVHAVTSLWSETALGVERITRQAFPRLKAGLKLQRCGGPEAEPKTTYDSYLYEGTQKLKGITFGLQWGDWCMQKPMEKGERVEGYDIRYWDKQEDAQAGCKLVLKPERKPAEAIDALFDPKNKKLWHVDCGQFVQLAHYYALLMVKGPDKFNEMIGPNMEFKKLGSTGLKRKALWGRRSKDELMQLHEVPPGGGEPAPVPGVEGRSEQEALDAAPFGSRVEFTNGFVTKIPTAVSGSYMHENTMKVGKDAFVAHPFTKGISSRNVFTKEELIDLINEGTEPQFREAARGYIYISEIEFYDLP